VIILLIVGIAIPFLFAVVRAHENGFFPAHKKRSFKPTASAV
jgi:hypothetical protein